jgi:uncharacterized membrane protein YfcA
MIRGMQRTSRHGDGGAAMRIALYLLVGLTVGGISGVMGIGGGVILVPALMWLGGYDLRQATGTSLAILALPTTLPAAYAAYRRGQVTLEPILWVAGAFVVGAWLGRVCLDYLPETTLRLLFGSLMVYAAVRLMVASDREATNALAGSVATAIAWLGFLGLRAVGRRCSRPRTLTDAVQECRERGHGDPDYFI